MRALTAIILALNLVGKATPPAATDNRVLIYFDVSGSMTAPGTTFVGDLHDQWLAEINRALAKFSKDLSATDHICLGTIASKILLAPQCSQGGPTDLVGIFKTLDQRGSPSAIGSAVWLGVEAFQRTRQPGTKDLIIVVTDGLTSGNDHSTSEVASFAMKNDVTVHTIVTRPAMWATASGPTMLRAIELMKQLAQQSGGTSTECSRSGSQFDCQKPSGGLAAVFSKILDEARTSAAIRIRHWSEDYRESPIGPARR